MSSTSTHVPTNVFHCLYGWMLFYCAYEPYFPYLFIRWCILCYHFLPLGIVLWLTWSKNVFFTYWCVSFWHIHHWGIAAAYGSSIFKFLRNLHTVSHYNSTDFPSFLGPQAAIQSKFLPAFVIFCYYYFLIIDVHNGVRWLFTVVRKFKHFSPPC
jgi:hypothetical protein